MKPADLEKFTEALYSISDYYRQRERPSAFTVQIWWESLKEFELQVVQRALIAHINRPDKDGQFMPTVASIRQLIGGTTGDAAALAWVKVTQAVQRVGCGTSVVFDDALIHRCIEDIGAWAKLGTTTEEEWQWTGKKFEQLYRAYMQRGERPEYPSRLIGFYEAQNANDGREIDEPTLIGNPELARKVLQGGSSAPRLAITRPGEKPALPAPRRAKRLAIESH